jgi:beta-galactosidase
MKIIFRILGILLALIIVLAIYFGSVWHIQFNVKPEKELSSYKGGNINYPFDNGKFKLPTPIDVNYTHQSEEFYDVEDENNLRRVISLNGSWKIEEGDLSHIPSEFTHTTIVPGFADMSEPEFIQVGEIKYIFGLGAMSPSGFLSLMKFKDKNREAFWYKKEFNIEGNLPDVSLLKIRKAKYGSEVWLNGVLLGSNSRHFLEGVYDASEVLKGNGAINELVVRVGTSVTNNSNNKNIYGDVLEKTKQFPGIYDDVELILSGNVYVSKVQAVPVLGEESVKILAWVENRSDNLVKSPVTFSVSDKTSGERCGAVKSDFIRIEAGEEVLLETVVPIKNIKLWTPESPDLYTLKVSTSNDALSTTFGMRDFHFDPESKVPMLNGQAYYLRGTSVPIYRFAEDPMRGDKLWDELWVRSLFRKFKSMNWNSLRFHVGPAPEMWYRIADEEGMIIQDEYAIWTYNMFRTGITLDTLVSEYVGWMGERWNHASVLIWDAQNESVQSKEHEQAGL